MHILATFSVSALETLHFFVNLLSQSCVRHNFQMEFEQFFNKKLIIKADGFSGNFSPQFTYLKCQTLENFSTRVTEPLENTGGLSCLWSNSNFPVLLWKWFCWRIKGVRKSYNFLICLPNCIFDLIMFTQNPLNSPLTFLWNEYLKI